MTNTHRTCDHDWQVVRMRGTRIREQCRRCRIITPWTKVAPALTSNHTPIDTDTLWTKTKADLADIAGRLGVHVSMSWTKQQMIVAITTSV